MLTGDELRAARESAGLTQQQLGDAVEVSMRSVGNWERADRVPPVAERRVRRAFPAWFGQPAAPLSSVSDAQLLAEIARRFDRGRKDGEGDDRDAAPITQAGNARDNRHLRSAEYKSVTGPERANTRDSDPPPPLDVAADKGPKQPGASSQDPDDQVKR